MYRASKSALAQGLGFRVFIMVVVSMPPQAYEKHLVVKVPLVILPVLKGEGGVGSLEYSLSNLHICPYTGTYIHSPSLDPSSLNPKPYIPSPTPP